MNEFINTIDILGDDVVIDSIINKTITEFKDDKLKKIGKGAFYQCGKLKTVVLPNVTYVDSEVFVLCQELRIIDFSSAVTFVRNGRTFADITNSNLKAIILRSEEVSHLENVLVTCQDFTTNKTCFLYVPSALVDVYKTNSDLSAYAEQIRALEDYTVDGTITGEFKDPDIVDPLYTFENVENSEIKSNSGNYSGTLTVSNGNHIKIVGGGSEWFWNVNVSSAVTHGQVGKANGINIDDTLFTIPAGATVKMCAKNTTFSNENAGYSFNVRVALGSSSGQGTLIGEFYNIQTSTANSFEKEITFVVENETVVPCVSMSIYPHNVNDFAEFDLEIYVNDERWI